MKPDLVLDDALAEAAVEVGHHRSKEEAVAAALQEFVESRRRFSILEWVGRVDYFEDYDPKKLRGYTALRP